jgi:hypothetical protein
MSNYDKMFIDDIIEFHVNHMAHDALRYQLFDLGKLLLRTDADGERNKKWRQMVHSYLDREVKTFFRLDAIEKRENEFETPMRNSDLIGTMFSCIEYHFMSMGKAVLDPDQHIFYIEELGAILGSVQRKIAEALAFKMLQQENVSLNHYYSYSAIKWDSYLCNHAISRPQFSFDVNEEYDKLLGHSPAYR